jgi:DNA-directed RNA polymerase subunit L
MIGDPATLETDSEKKAQLVREFETLEVNRCYLKDARTGEPYSFDFVIESVGVLSPEYIVLRACEMGASLCEKYTSNVFPDNLIVQESDSRFSAFDFFFQKEDHTLGNLIQTWIDAHKIDSGEVTFIGYDIPHPLRDEMVLRMGVADGKEATARSVLSEAMASCQAMFRSWRDNWASLTNPIIASSQPIASSTTIKPAKKKVVRLSTQGAAP